MRIGGDGDGLTNSGLSVFAVAHSFCVMSCNALNLKEIMGHGSGIL